MRNARRHVRGATVETEGGARHHHGALAVVSQRPRQPRDRAGDPGRRPHPRARLDVRATPLRVGTDEWHGRRHVPCRRPPHHRHWPDTAPGRENARYPRPPLGHVTDRGRPRRGWADARRAARDGRTRLQPARRAAQESWREDREGRVGPPDVTDATNYVVGGWAG